MASIKSLKIKRMLEGNPNEHNRQRRYLHKLAASYVIIRGYLREAEALSEYEVNHAVNKALKEMVVMEDIVYNMCLGKRRKARR